MPVSFCWMSVLRCARVLFVEGAAGGVATVSGCGGVGVKGANSFCRSSIHA